MSAHSKYDHHRKTAQAQADQQLENCALLCAYVHGSPSGWYGIVDSHIDGFRSDYAMVHSNPGNFESHPVRAFYVLGTEDYMEELEEIRALVKEAHHMAELPLVTTLTAEEKEDARLAVREALEEAQPEDAELWVKGLCGNIGSDLHGTDWQALVEAIKK